ncbi:hypothetical protein ACJX0J_039730, partial [Zea mays]
MTYKIKRELGTKRQGLSDYVAETSQLGCKYSKDLTSQLGAWIVVELVVVVLSQLSCRVSMQGGGVLLAACVKIYAPLDVGLPYYDIGSLFASNWTGTKSAKQAWRQTFYFTLNKQKHSSITNKATNLYLIVSADNAKNIFYAIAHLYIVGYKLDVLNDMIVHLHEIDNCTCYIDLSIDMYLLHHIDHNDKIKRR